MGRAPSAAMSGEAVSGDSAQGETAQGLSVGIIPPHRQPGKG